MLNGITVGPTWNVLAPCSVMFIESALAPLSDCSSSAVRPAQPKPSLESGSEVIHWNCWS